MPSTSSFFNLLEDLKVRFPCLARQELIMLGSYIWKQLTWEEKYPYMVKAWRSKKKHLRAQNSAHMTVEIKMDFMKRLREYVAEKSPNGMHSGIAQFLKIMSTKVWNQMIFAALGNGVQAGFDRSIDVFAFYRQMRKLKKDRKTQK